MRALAAVAALLALAVLPAQEQVVVHADGDRQIVSLRVTAFGGSRPGGLGFVCFDAENHDGQPHAIEVSFASQEWNGGDVAASRSLVLGPRERGRFHLPRPTNTLGTFFLDVAVDRVRQRSTIGDAPAGVVGLLITERADLQPWGATVMQALPARISTAPELQLARPEHLPADWRLFTGHDAVVVDGRARLPAEVQEALRRFVFAGGTVIVGDAARLPAGPLRDLVGADGPQPVAHGLGRCAAVSIDGGSGELRARLAVLPRTTMSGWPLPRALQRAQEIPGLGGVPVLVFLSVILLFAIVAGPVNFVLARRWKRPLLVLATVPALGVGTTLAMLAYGFVHDGLGVRGVVRSWTLLDQARHEAAVIASRTLFCGLSPRSFATPHDSFVLSPRAMEHAGSREPDRWHFDGDRELVDGGALPSRRATPLLSAQQGIVRERLRVRTTAGDEIELVTDGGIEPVGEIVLRDLDGVCWAGTAPRLQRVAATAAAEAVERWLGQAAVFWVSPEPRMSDHWVGPPGPVEEDGPTSLHAMIARFVGNELPPGTFVAMVRSAPWLDEHGVAVDYDAVEHFVVGRLAPEDFVR